MAHFERNLAGHKRKVEAIHADYTRQIQEQQVSYSKKMEATKAHYTQQQEAMKRKMARLELQLQELKADNAQLTDSNAQLTASNGCRRPYRQLRLRRSSRPGSSVCHRAAGCNSRAAAAGGDRPGGSCTRGCCCALCSHCHAAWASGFTSIEQHLHLASRTRVSHCCETSSACNAASGRPPQQQAAPQHQSRPAAFDTLVVCSA